jgi:anthranilate phosphoribosyltransferase
LLPLPLSAYFHPDAREEHAVELPRPPWFDPAFATLLAGADLPSDTAAAAFRDLLQGRVDDVLAAAFVTALRVKGESPSEVAAAARGLREQMIRLVPVSGPVLDTCGTGGDDAGTFNISTAAALVVAGAGVPVVKHGNRAVSSKSGSADVLRALGVPIETGPEWAQRCLDRVGFAFCYAPHFHQGMAHVATLRRKLGVRTIFNLLGPLANPANADFQLIGVGSAELLDVLAAALAELNVRRAILVCGFDGLDEVTLAAPTMVRIVEGDQYFADEWDRSDFGLDTVPLHDIRAADAAQSAGTIRRVLDGEHGSARDIVLANAAAALFAAEVVKNLHDGVLKAAESIDTGAAKGVLERLIS